MKITEKNISEIMELPLDKAFKLYQAFMIEYQDLEEDYPKILDGIRITFDIRDHFTNRNIILEKKRAVGIFDENQQRIYVKLRDYRNEMDEREAMIRHNLLNILQEEDIVTGHSKNEEA